MVKTIATAAESSHTDANQLLSLIAVQGTLGTSDVGGTAKTVPLGANEQTGALYVQDLSGAAGTTNIQGSVQVTGGTLQALLNGSINILSGTVLNSGTNVNVITGTQQLLTTVSNLTNGSVNILTGTLLNTGTNINMVTGTQQLVTTVSNLTNGSVNILTGTLQSSGTTTGVGVVTNLTNGSVNVLTGTFNLGTVVNNGGTIQLGTVIKDPIPTRTQSTFGTVGTTGASVVGTLAGGTSSGAGTELFITGVSIVIPANAGSQDVSVGFGTAAGTFHSGTAVLIRGFFVAGGGISRTFAPAINSGTNAQVAYFQAGAGTASIDITYFTAASTL